MTGLLKTLVRVGVIAGILAGAATLIAGPDRTAALVNKVHRSVMETIDENIDDPTALRSQLRDLEKQVPERISRLRGDLAELREQIHQLERDQSIAERVVVLADRDLAALAPGVDGARPGAPTGQPVSVQFEGRVWTPRQAYGRASQIRQVRNAYASRQADAVHDLSYLRQQAERLEELLGQLETERAQLQAQVWQLDRQVDTIARNERLIELIEKRERTIEQCSRYEVASLDQLHGHLAQIRTRQEATLEMLAGDVRRHTYEEAARLQIDAERMGDGSLAGGMTVEPAVALRAR